MTPLAIRSTFANRVKIILASIASHRLAFLRGALSGGSPPLQ
jgi:hypothetical protein